MKIRMCKQKESVRKRQKMLVMAKGIKRRRARRETRGNKKSAKKEGL